MRKPGLPVSSTLAPDQQKERPTSAAEQRREQLLQLIVREFIKTGRPVSSLRAARIGHLGVSSATLRNMMAELESEGYLCQPHSSAGRIPTAKAFRLYVDTLMPLWQVAWRDRAQIELNFSEPVTEPSEPLQRMSRLLVLLTGYAAVVTGPRFETAAIQRVDLIRTREREVLAVVATRTAGVLTRLIKLETDPAQEQLDQIAHTLTQLFQGTTLDAAQDRLKAVSVSAAGSRGPKLGNWLAEDFAREILVRRTTTDVFVEGSPRILNHPEFEDRERIRELLELLEDRGRLVELLERSLRYSSFSVSIGAVESGLRTDALSVVAAAYSSGETPLGSVAVVGPLRMDYGRIVPLVDYTARTLSRLYT